jgi:Asp-tRNA(Asn)/Glu-tRNA(Gln) amidotransferase A subunit family amidase
MHDSLFIGIAEMVRRYRTHEINPAETVDAHIERIEAVNDKINALVTPMYDHARAEARRKTDWLLNEHRIGDELSPFFGVPITIKDCWPVRDVRFTAGSWYRRNQFADDDAPVVAMLREAGAIILGKSNCPDMSWLGETTNPIFGQTSNPHNLEHIAGGSSGGEGALIGAGASPFGVGSDIAGSVRIPAAATGCVSLKPSAERIPNDGHVPKTPDAINGWNTPGLMGRRIEDLALGLKLLSTTETSDYREIDIYRMRCLMYIESDFIKVDKAIEDGVRIAATALIQLGMIRMDERSLPMIQALLFYAGLFDKEARQYLKRELGGGEPYSFLREVWRNRFGDPRITGRVLVFDKAMGIMGKFARLLGFNSFEKLVDLRNRFIDYLEGGVLMLPVFLDTVPKHGWTYRSLYRPPYTLMFNVLGFPAVVLPVHKDPDGMPVAVQIVAPPGEDEMALAVASHLEREFGGWQRADNL